MQENNLILRNGNVITMDPLYPSAESVVIQKNLILSVAKNGMANHQKPGDEVINCQRKTILPGFIDAHCHFFGLAESFILPNIGPEHARSIPEIQNILKRMAANTPAGTWIRARGYHSFGISEKRHPNRWDLDEISKTHPICLTHRTGYIHLLNSLALVKAGIDSSTPEPPGGLFERDLISGEPNGVLYGMGQYLSKVIPPIEETRMLNAIKLASEQLIALGITSVQDLSQANGINRWNMLVNYKRHYHLNLRITIAAGLNAFLNGQLSLMSEQDDYLRARGVKLVLSEATGEMYPSLANLKELILKIHSAGLQANVHAIEQHIVEAAVESIEHAIQISPSKGNRHRLEHCSVCPPELARRIATLGILVVSQPNFVFYNGDRYLKTVPENQLPNLYAFKTLIESGIKVAAGSDCPVVPANPFNGIYSAVTRKTCDGSVLNSEQAISVIDAIRMYTINAAYASFEEHKKGSISPGKLADIIVLNYDPTKIKPEQLRELKVELVILGGKIVYRNGL